MSIRGLNCRQHSLCPFQTVFPMSTVGGRLLKLMDHRPDPQGISEVHIISGGQRCLNFFMSLALCTPFLKFFCSILQVENCHREQRTAMMNHCNGEPLQIRELHFFGGGWVFYCSFCHDEFSGRDPTFLILDLQLSILYV